MVCFPVYWWIRCFGQNLLWNTVQNEFEFPGDLSVGLPTLVQNPPTANDIANPTGLDRRLLLYELGRKKGKKKEKKEKKLAEAGGRTHGVWANTIIVDCSSHWAMVTYKKKRIFTIIKLIGLTGKSVLFWFGGCLTE